MSLSQATALICSITYLRASECIKSCCISYQCLLRDRTAKIRGPGPSIAALAEVTQHSQAWIPLILYVRESLLAAVVSEAAGRLAWVCSVRQALHVCVYVSVWQQLIHDDNVFAEDSAQHQSQSFTFVSKWSWKKNSVLQISWLSRTKILIGCKVVGLIPQIYPRPLAREKCQIYFFSIVPSFAVQKGKS